MEKLMVINPDFNSEGKDVVILGTGRAALLLHTTMIQEGIYVSAFCTDSKDLVGSRIMGKDVIPFDVVRKSPSRYLVLIGEENLETAHKQMEDEGIDNTWADSRMYSLISDCVWSFM